ncbi:hypothetical protein N7532_009725 [Penicillium argentinense]|uniref:Uncharacterized protein n=1 Tax=Penicillium argentinense TaxID=1131581 RepID=A0A9W9F047_9EURO|nr:uncharacterized protein N7532_009725 [Penicillium argentinense]KAJ5091041.1 hypothetical protein N7532_009725 [Penicillium argentinense]
MAPPTFLADEPAHKRYLEQGAAGNLVFPDYDLDTEGDIIVVPGEAFCRVKDCIVAKTARDTRNLRAHIASAHGLSVSKSRTGNISISERQASRVDWFRSLIRGTEEVEVEGEDVEGDAMEAEEDVEVEEEEQEKPPIPLTATDRISKLNTRRALVAAGYATLDSFPCSNCQGTKSASNCPANPHICDFHEYFDVSACVSYQ